VYFLDLFLIGLLGFLFWVGFFAQFVLPLDALGDRFLAFHRLVLYILGGHGPAVRIENGRYRLREKEEKRRGPGVVLLDTASAAMLRRKTGFTRPVGPGVVFTKAGEYVHGEEIKRGAGIFERAAREAIDLHIQDFPSAAPLGPFENEDPFAPRKKNEKPEEFQARQDRRRETSALTRDGVEVVANFVVRSKIHSYPGEGGTRFGYNSESVRRAVTREGIVPEELRNMPWYEVPVHLAVEAWREYVGKFTVNELFNIEAEETDLDTIAEVTETMADLNFDIFSAETGLETAVKMVRWRMTEAAVPELDAYGEPTGAIQPSQEFALLTEMGVDVESAAVVGLRFPEAVEEQLVRQWVSTWLEHVKGERKHVEQRRSQHSLLGQETALFEFVEGVTGNLWTALLDDYGFPRINPDGTPMLEGDPYLPNRQRSLELLLLGTRQLIIQNAQLRGMLADEEARLAEMLAWVRS
jgi:hypothetical protein